MYDSNSANSHSMCVCVYIYYRSMTGVVQAATCHVFVYIYILSVYDRCCTGRHMSCCHGSDVDVDLDMVSMFLYQQSHHWEYHCRGILAVTVSVLD